MILAIPYNEITRYLSSHFGQKVKLSYISGNEVEAVYSHKFLLVNINIKVEITVESVKSTTIVLCYEGNKAVELALSKGLEFVKSRNPALLNGLKVDSSNHKITIDLSKIPQMKNILTYLKLQDIVASEKALHISFTLK